jgi:hypothetical protein
MEFRERPSRHSGEEGLKKKGRVDPTMSELRNLVS